MNEKPTEDPGDAALTPRRQETRLRLIEAAAEVFVEEGLQGASVESICARAGFTRGAFYSNFSSKEQLFLAALTRQYEQRAEQLRQRAEALLPQLQDCSGTLTPAEVSRFATELLLPISPVSGWFALETEFMLLAMRDPDLASGFTDMLDNIKFELVDVIEELVSAAGRRFVIPADRAIAAFEGLHERALRFSALSGQPPVDGMAELGERITELLFAITEPV